MVDIKGVICPNEDCKDYGQRGKGNIGTRARYGKNKERVLLYCRTCGKRFIPSRGTVFFSLQLPTETVSQIIHHAAEGVGVRETARYMGLTVNRVVLWAKQTL